jgi:Ulp1 family protease
VDIFSKDFLFVPIHDALHWSLAIICHPALIAQRMQQMVAQQQQKQQVPAAEAAGAAALARAAGGGSAAAAAAFDAAAVDTAAAAAAGDGVEAQPVIIHLDSMTGEAAGRHRQLARELGARFTCAHMFV